MEIPIDFQDSLLRSVGFKGMDVVITAYGIARTDNEKFKKQKWHSLVIDDMLRSKKQLANLAVANGENRIRQNGLLCPYVFCLIHLLLFYFCNTIDCTFPLPSVDVQACFLFWFFMIIHVLAKAEFSPFMVTVLAVLLHTKRLVSAI